MDVDRVQVVNECAAVQDRGRVPAVDPVACIPAEAGTADRDARSLEPRPGVDSQQVQAVGVAVLHRAVAQAHGDAVHLDVPRQHAATVTDSTVFQRALRRGRAVIRPV